MREALLQAVYAAPEDDGPRAVFADWLLLNGEPELGEFIQLQLRRPPGKKPKPREKELFVQGSKWFWPDHPWTISTGGNGAFAEIDRGFPARVSASDASAKKRIAYARNPGWATVREVYAMGDGLLGVELPDMPLLRSVSCSGGLLAAFAGASRRIETLKLSSEELPPRLGEGRFPALRKLVIEAPLVQAPTVPLASMLEALAAMGLLSTIRELSLPLEIFDGELRLALETFARLPRSIERLAVGDVQRQGYLDRTATAPSLELSLCQFHIDELMPQLRALPADSLSRVHVILPANGHYSKKNREPSEVIAREAIRHFPEHTVSSPTK